MSSEISRKSIQLKEERYFDLESELNDIDVMLDEMNTGGKSLTKDSTDEVVDLNKQHNMEVEVKGIGICTFGSNGETNVGNEIEIKREEKQVTDNIDKKITDDEEEKQVTDNVDKKLQMMKKRNKLQTMLTKKLQMVKKRNKLQTTSTKKLQMMKKRNKLQTMPTKNYR